jgi:twitching motility protein PilT
MLASERSPVVAWIGSLLSILVERGADELRVGEGREPQLFVAGKPRRLSIPKMSRRDVEDLLGDLLSPERKAVLATGQPVEFAYSSANHGAFTVTLSGENDLSAVFVKVTRGPALAAPVLSAPTRAPPPEDPVRTDGATSLLVEAAGLGASDLHVRDGEIPLVRIDGALRPLPRAKTEDVLAALGLSPEDRNTLLARGSLDLSARLAGVGAVRIHVYRAGGGIAAAVRLLPDSAPLLSKLGMPVALDDLAMLPHGLVLACGPAGAGKSTTLAALAQEALRRRSIVMVTLEDPVEFGLEPGERSVVRRRQLGRDVGTFAEGLRDALREDPDVLVVGEMRDPETIALALTAAETGHLVLGSMHGRSASSAVQRIFDSYPPERQLHIRAQLAEVLRAVVAQRLVRRTSGGRVPVIELLRVTTAVANTIREGRTASLASLLQAGRREGMLSLERCLADRVRAGEITLEDARAVAGDQSSLVTYLSD